MSLERPSREEVDAELELAIMGYDRRDKYPEWGNAAMREAYRAGMEDGRHAVKSPIRELHRPFDRPLSWGNTQTERVCAHCLGPISWPCATARLVYAEDEL
ncbi:hypothetical protein [Mycolicibacterium bacteremicum]|uniref:Uncharacterized protein n=1 Tax=Mycolicibacterium bacteremicum TaxID=564198 RepID=A0A1W9YQ82_MYCBA|nr:hypothetical protein [Mycolicibacterium bacteremicum]MCV7434850.1 hypothetical protein [Mycolicibacterium bacteremicum]ORA02147.1 hypothetical protein BST17_24875 [Mycolicibacterium bacteremicum]